MRFLVLLAAASLAAAAQDHKVSREDALQVHEGLLLIDTHNDVPMKTLRGYDIGDPAPKGSTDIPRLRRGNVGAQFFAAYVAAKYARQGKAAEQCRRMIGTILEDIIGKHPEVFRLATTADGILGARREGRIAALIGIEGGHAIEDSIEKLQEFFSSGVRYMTLTHSNTNNWADSSGDINNKKVKHHGGLTGFGRRVIREMNRLGMMVDVSHVADVTFWDVIETSQAPVIASHSSCRAISKAPRNMTDDMIRAMAGKGGVIHINFACDFLNENVRREDPRAKQALGKKHPESMDALREAMEKRFKRATLADVVAHIDHAVKVGGIDSVGIGSDFDGIDCAPVGLDDVSKFPNLTHALLEKGYTPEQIGKIYGGNTLRVMREVERVARQMQKQ